MARTRGISDEELLAATARVVDRSGPIAFTLAEVAREVGVTAPLLLQRFGTKRGLLLALADSGAAEVDGAFAKGRADHKRALDALHAALLTLAHPATARSIANGLAFLQLDVTDVAFRARALKFFDAFRTGARSLIKDAVRNKELRRVDVEELARAIEVAYHGSILSWALRQEGSCEAALRRDIESVLAPHRPPKLPGSPWIPGSASDP